MVEKIVLCVKGGVPEEGEGGRIAGGQEADMRVRGEQGEKRGVWRAAKGEGVKGIYKDVDWSCGWGSGELGED